MSFKTLIFFGFLAVTLGFTLPEQNSADFESEWVYGDVVPVADDVVLVRKARSPQGSVTGNLENSDSRGLVGSIDYKNKLGADLAASAGASRNFNMNENSGYASLGSKSLSGAFEHSDSRGSSASVDFTRPISKNLDFHAGVARDFRQNDNSGYAGLSSGPLSGTFKHSDSMGSSAILDYRHPVSRNLDVYAGASRNFRFNDNRAHAGLEYRFGRY